MRVRFKGPIVLCTVTLWFVEQGSFLQVFSFDSSRFVVAYS